MPHPSSGSQNSYSGPTKLSEAEEKDFQAWAKHNKLNMRGQDAPTADYDVRGFYKAMKEGTLGRPLEESFGISPFDQQMHMSDEFKTPYHETLSNESRYAADTTHPDAQRAVSQNLASPGVGAAARWMGDRLVDPAKAEPVADEGMQSPQGPDEEAYVEAARRAQSVMPK